MSSYCINAKDDLIAVENKISDYIQDPQVQDMVSKCADLSIDPYYITIQ